MKKFTSLLVACTFCFLGLALTGCGGRDEATVIEGAVPENSTSTEEARKQYEAEMAAEMAKSRGN